MAVLCLVGCQNFVRMDGANRNDQQLAWLIAFISSIIATAEHTPERFPNYSWFAVIYMLFVIIGVFVLIVTDTTETYHVAIVGYLACGLVLTSSSVDSVIRYSNGAKEANAAGHILLSMINVCCYFPWHTSNAGTNSWDRLYGSSISDQHPPPSPEHILTPLRCTKTTSLLRADEQ